MRKFSLVFLLGFGVLIAGGQRPAAAQTTLILHEPVGDTEHLGQVATDGTVTVSSESMSDCCWTSNVSTYDPETDTIFFLGGLIAGDPTSGTRRVISYDYDGANLTVTASPALSSDYNYNFLEYDTSTNTLYSIAYNSALAGSSGGTTRQHELLTVNPTTGAVSTVGSPIADCCWTNSGVSTFDQTAGQFLFLGGKYTDASSSNRRVFTIDVSDGSVVANPLVDGGSTDFSYNFVAMVPTTGELYTFAYNVFLANNSNPQVKREELHRIDRSTGTLTMVGSGITDCCSVSANAATYDSDNNDLLFLAAYTTSSSDKRIFKLDPTDGSLTGDPVIDTGATTYFYNGLEYRTDPTTCRALTVGHTGSGGDPVVSPTQSSACTAGMYTAGESLTVTAAPAGGWIVAQWTGTDADSFHGNSNSATMPASTHEILAHYAIPIALMDFETGNTSQWSSAVGEVP